MTLVSRSSFGSGERQVGEENMHELTKDLWINDAGVVAEGKGKHELPKGWTKGKLLGKAGQEVAKADFDAWTKAKKKVEDKSKK